MHRVGEKNKIYPDFYEVKNSDHTISNDFQSSSQMALYELLKL